MRFTKQLTACVAAIIVVVGTAGPVLSEQTCNAANSGSRLDVGQQQANMIRRQMTRLFMGDVGAPDCPEAVYLDAVGPPFPQKGLSELRAERIKTAKKIIGDDSKHYEYYYGKGTIVGETIEGKRMTIECNPGACTVGSLNRFSVLTGAPMMVPAKMFIDAHRDIKAANVGMDKRSIWKTVADVIWSDPQKLTKITETYDDENTADVVEYKIEDDVNGIRAKAIYAADPTAYKSKQKAFKKSLNTEDKIGVLITKGFVSTAETGDPGVVVSTDVREVVVTETVVTCTSDGQTDCVDAHDQ